MPTPSDDTRRVLQLEHERSTPHATCPPENGRSEQRRTHDRSLIGQDDSPSLQAQQPHVSLLGDSEIVGQAENDVDHDAHMKMDDIDQDHSSTDGQSPMSTTTESGDAEPAPTSSPTPSTRLSSSYSTSYEFSNIRVSQLHYAVHSMYVC